MANKKTNSIMCEWREAVAHDLIFSLNLCHSRSGNEKFTVFMK